MTVSEVVPQVRRAGLLVVFVSVLTLAVPTPALALDLTLGWDASTDPTVVGYNLYYGTTSRGYTNMVVAGSATTVTISNLASAVTYYFAATSVDNTGLESVYSAEASFGPAANLPPTLDPIADMTINENDGLHTVSLAGISSGSSNEVQTLTITAFSSNPALIPNPNANYSSPAATGSLTFAPMPNSFGAVSMTVMVDDGGVVSNTLIRVFNVTVNPFNIAPTLDPISDLVINENAGPINVNLAGISAGGTNEVQPLSITATSSNPGLVPNPLVNYTSPNSTGSLSLTPVTNRVGTAIITVTVNDGQPLNNTVSSSFAVTVNPSLVVTNANVFPNSTFKFVINPPFTNGDKFIYSLGTNAPIGAGIVTRRGVTSLVWTPTTAQASTTNLITLQLTDTTKPALSTNELVRVVVLDYVAVGVGWSAAQTGQSVVLPLTLDSSDGVTNLSFAIGWPTNRFANPSLFVALSGVQSNSVQPQGTNLLISLQTKPGVALFGSNVLAQLSFQVLSSQSSAFVPLPVRNLAAMKPAGTAYVNPVPGAGRLVVVGNAPLLEGLPQPTGRSLELYGKVGASYQVQFATSLAKPILWQPLLTYAQTNVSQPLNLSATPPLIFYRLHQQ
jgi:hypothetical protein